MADDAPSFGVVQADDQLVLLFHGNEVLVELRLLDDVALPLLLLDEFFEALIIWAVLLISQIAKEKRPIDARVARLDLPSIILVVEDVERPHILCRHI